MPRTRRHRTVPYTFQPPSGIQPAWGVGVAKGLRYATSNPAEGLWAQGGRLIRPSYPNSQYPTYGTEHTLGKTIISNKTTPSPIEFESATYIDPADGITLMGMFKQVSSAGQGALISWNGSGGTNAGLALFTGDGNAVIGFDNNYYPYNGAFTAGKVYVVFMTLKTNDFTNVWVYDVQDRVLTSGTSTAVTTSVTAARGLSLGAAYNADSVIWVDPSNMHISGVAVWDRVLSQQEIARLAPNPWALWRQPAQGTRVRGGSSLPTTVGSFTTTGNAASTTVARKLVAEDGTFTTTGNTVGLTTARKLIVDDGSFTTTGNAAALAATRRLIVDDGTFTETGRPAVLATTRKLYPDDGTFNLTGNAATLDKTRNLVADDGTFALTGNAASTTVARKLIVDDGSFTTTGSAVVASKGYQVTNTPGTFNVATNEVGLTKQGAQRVLYIRTAVPGASNYQGYVLHQTVLSGPIDITVEARLRAQRRTVPFEYETYKIRFAVDTSEASLYNYTFEFFTNNTWQLHKRNASYSSVIASGAFSFQVGRIYSIRTTYDPSSGAIRIYVDGSLLVSLTDSVPLPQGRYGFSALNSDSEFNNVSGSITDTFDNYSIGDTLQGGFIGPWEVWYLDDDADTAGIRTGQREMFITSGAFNVTANNVTLSTSSTYRMQNEPGLFTTTGSNSTLSRTRLLSVTPGEFALTGGDVENVHDITVGAEPTSVLVTANQVELTKAVGPGRSRASTMAMFQAHHTRMQSELRRRLAADLPLEEPIATAPSTIKHADKRFATGKRRMLTTNLPQPVVKGPVAQNQRSGYTAKAGLFDDLVINPYEGEP